MRKFHSKRLNFIRSIFASEIPFKFIRRKDIRFPHAVGIVVATKVKIGSGVMIYSRVTIGGKKPSGDGDIEYPVIEDNVVISTGASIIGGVTVGEGSFIGANTVITKDVPPGSVVVNDTKLRFLNEE